MLCAWLDSTRISYLDGLGRGACSEVQDPDLPVVPCPITRPDEQVLRARGSLSGMWWELIQISSLSGMSEHSDVRCLTGLLSCI